MSGLERHRHEAAVELANCTHEMGRLERTLDSRTRFQDARRSGSEGDWDMASREVPWGALVRDLLTAVLKRLN